ALVTVGIEQPFRLRPDTTICYEDTLNLYVPPGVTDWQWNTGSRNEELPVTTPGTYTLTGETQNCTFTDSVQVEFYTCEECPNYAPNVFSPNDDGVNDEWQIFLPCNWLKFRLEVHDRWGSLVFATDDPETGWDGFIRGKEPVPGVYVWSMEWTGELFGEPKVFRSEGDVTVVR
ncbi:MAG TPA: gliding motility-associated C-terminal domain-containing protein, partial [Saprospiraceae bacterium]|nr:gliding motility-associated C-terminal domain-containing protein [Saprospiraceae bacterium]